MTESIFFDEQGNLRSFFRFALFLLFFFAALALLGIIAWSALVSIGQRTGLAVDELVAGPVAMLVHGGLMLAAAVGVGWFCGRAFEGLPCSALGWTVARGWWRDLLFGTVVGAGTFLAAAFVPWAFGSIRFEANAAPWAAVGGTLLLAGAVFAVAAAAEESAFRGYPLQTMLRAHPLWIAALPSSLVFALVHMGNPNTAPAFTFVNTLLAGFWLAVGYCRTRNLWFPLGLHWAWNWTQGAVLGFPVSGLTTLAEAPLLRAQDFGPAWLTGGAYGIEGGLSCTVAIVLSTAAIARGGVCKGRESRARSSGTLRT